MHTAYIVINLLLSASILSWDDIPPALAVLSCQLSYQGRLAGLR